VVDLDVGGWRVVRIDFRVSRVVDLDVFLILPGLREQVGWNYTIYLILFLCKRMVYLFESIQFAG
jgi:hypothetical protein